MSGKVLIFVEQKKTAELIEQLLFSCDMSVASIHGDRVQQERELSLNEFKSGNRPILIATDVAARGLDIPNVENVINFDFPKALESYIHRMGRTGRAGKEGTVTSLITNDVDFAVRQELVKLL
jgi:ATP-dependent RNA helicase DDX3X